MHRIDGAGHVNNQFVSEDPATNRPPTEVTAEILNALQEELASVVERTGRVLDKSNNTQVGDSIQNMIEARVGDYNLDTGTANAKVVALNPAIAAYTGNFGGAFKNAVANNGAVTVDFGAGAVPLVNDAGAALIGGDLPAGGVIGYQYIHADAKAYVTSLVQSQTVGTVIISEDATNIAGSTTLDIYTDTANLLTVMPGRWIIFWNGRLTVVSSGGTGFCLPELTLTDAANTVIKKAKGLNALAGLSVYASPISSFAVVDVAVPTTFKLRFCASAFSGTPAISNIDTVGTSTKTTLMGVKL